MQVSDPGQAGVQLWKNSMARVEAVSMVVEWEDQGDAAGELVDSMFEFISRFLNNSARGDGSSLSGEQYKGPDH